MVSLSYLCLASILVVILIVQGDAAGTLNSSSTSSLTPLTSNIPTKTPLICGPHDPAGCTIVYTPTYYWQFTGTFADPKFDWSGYASSTCAPQYASWTLDVIASSYSSRYPSETLTAAPSFPPKPNCCDFIFRHYVNQSRVYEESVTNQWFSDEAASKASYKTTTSTTITTSTNEAWLSCEAARTTTLNTWTWVDGYPRVNVSINSKSCTEPVFNTEISTSIDTVPGWDLRLPFPSPTPCHDQCSEPDLDSDFPYCLVADHGVEILYWPVSLTSSGTATFTVPPSETGIVTAEYDGTTLTSPTVYIRFPTLYAGNYLDVYEYYDTPCSTRRIGKNYSNIIIPVPTSVALSTVYRTAYDLSDVDAGMVTEAVNYADWYPNPLPLRVWQQYCSDCTPYKSTSDACATIATDACSHHPMIKRPFAVRDLNPEWENCRWYEFQKAKWGAYYDSPHPLLAKPALSIPIITSKTLEPTLSPAKPPSYPSAFHPSTAPPMRTPNPPPPIGVKGPSLGASPNPNHNPDQNLNPNHSDAHVEENNQNDPSHQPIAIITLGNKLFTAHPGELDLQSTTLHPGDAAVTVSGHVVSMAREGMMLDGTMYGLSSPTATSDAALASNAVVMTLAGMEFTRLSKADGDEVWLGAGTTVKQGETVTINGSVVTVKPLGTTAGKGNGDSDKGNSGTRLFVGVVTKCCIYISLLWALWI